MLLVETFVVVFAAGTGIDFDEGDGIGPDGAGTVADGFDPTGVGVGEEEGTEIGVGTGVDCSKTVTV